MGLNPTIIDSPTRMIVGVSAQMSYSNMPIPQLWKKFKPMVEEIEHKKDELFYAIQVYTNDHFETFDPEKLFEVWAGVAVADFNVLPNPFLCLVIPAGKYAVFTLVGQDIGGLYSKIIGEWIPNSSYAIANRPHFQVMGDQYKNNQPDSEEEVWFPIQ